MTGASSGIGRQIALALGRKGCRVALLARNRESLSAVGRELEQAGGEALVLPVDVTDEPSVGEAVHRAVETFGSLRLVVANAGLGRYALVEEQAGGLAERLVEVNYLGTVHTVRHALPHLLAAAPSHVVAVASSAGLIPHRLGSAYCASKAAVIQYMATLRLEVFDRGVGVTWVCPGAVRTPFFEGSNLDPETDLPLLARLLVRTLEPEEVARATVRAVERNRREVVVPAAVWFFAWTRRLAPGLADWVNRKLP